MTNKLVIYSPYKPLLLSTQGCDLSNIIKKNTMGLNLILNNICFFLYFGQGTISMEQIMS